jgi:hypothetical protein
MTILTGQQASKQAPTAFIEEHQSTIDRLMLVRDLILRSLATVFTPANMTTTRLANHDQSPLHP